MKILIAAIGSYPDQVEFNGNSSNKFDNQRWALRLAHQRAVDTIPNVSWASFKTGADHGSDSYHYTPAAYGDTLGRREAQSIAKALSVTTSDGRGPIVTAATRSGATLRLTIDRNGLDAVSGPVDISTHDRARVASPVNSFKGYEVSADDFATRLAITGIAVYGSDFVITLAAAPAGPIKVRSMAGATYDDTSQFVGSYAGGFTIAVAAINTPLTSNQEHSMRHLIVIAVLGLAACTATPALAQSITVTPSPTWRDCATEGATCGSRAGALVRYGVGATYVHRVVNGAVKCDNPTFGDPASNRVKTCAIASPASTTGPKPTPAAAPLPASVPVTTLAPVRPVATGRAALGINVTSVIYWSGEATFANQALGLQWRDPNAGWAYVPDARLRDGVPSAIEPGHPLTAALNAPAPAYRGEDATTRCTWKGTGQIGISEARRIISRDAKSLTFAWPKATTAGSARIDLIATSAGDPVRAIDCRLLTDGADAVFAPQLLDYLKPFGVLRFLDWSSANSNPASVTWATRGQPRGNSIGGSDGTALEYQVALANAVDASPWFTIPMNADEDYHRRAALLVKAAIPANRQVYVELSNEVWNYAFGQANQAKAEGVAAKLSDDPYQAALRRYAERVTAAMTIWSQVFADRPGQLVRVLGVQSSNAWAGEVTLDWKDTAKHVDAIAIAPYFSVDLATGGTATAPQVSRVAAAARETLAREVPPYAALAKKYGLRLVTYEAGQHLVDPARVPLVTAINSDPAMEAIYRQYLADWQAATGDLMTLYAATGPMSQYGAWGLREYAGQPIADTPKLRGVLDYAKGWQ